MSTSVQHVVGETSPAIDQHRGDLRCGYVLPNGTDIEGRRRRRLRRGSLIDTSKVAGYVFKVSETREEVESALRVIYTCYRQFGLVDAMPEDVRVTFHHILPHTRILIAKKDHEVHSTLTMVPDGAFGLPMEHEFKESIQPLREKQARIAEITSLATLPEHRRMNLFMYLYKLLLFIGQRIGLTDFVLVVNPKHVRFYRDILLFEQIGPERPYGAVSGAPGVPFRMNIHRTLSEGRRIYTKANVEQNLYEFFSGPWNGCEVALGLGRPPEGSTLRFLLRALPIPRDVRKQRLLAELHRESSADIDWVNILRDSIGIS
jgi:hypothetical protein